MVTPELLEGLEPDARERVMALGSRVTVPAESVLFRLGEPADTVFIVTRGRIALTLPMRVLGREENVLIEETLTGQTLGWSALTPSHRFTLTAMATFEAEVLALPRDALIAHFEAEPAVGYIVARNAANLAGRRLQVFQAMWLREMQRVVRLRMRGYRETA